MIADEEGRRVSPRSLVAAGANDLLAILRRN
jgi:hypothetical protein